MGSRRTFGGWPVRSPTGLLYILPIVGSQTLYDRLFGLVTGQFEQLVGTYICPRACPHRRRVSRFLPVTEDAQEVQAPLATDVIVGENGYRAASRAMRVGNR